MTITFSFGKTSIAFPPDHPTFGGLSFDATVIRRLSFLDLDFLPGTVDPVAMLSFPVVRESVELWHRRFGHLGQESTRQMLTKKLCIWY